MRRVKKLIVRELLRTCGFDQARGSVALRRFAQEGGSRGVAVVVVPGAKVVSRSDLKTWRQARVAGHAVGTPDNSLAFRTLG